MSTYRVLVKDDAVSASEEAIEHSVWSFESVSVLLRLTLPICRAAGLLQA